MKNQITIIFLYLLFAACSISNKISQEKSSVYDLPKTAVKIERNKLPANQQISSPTIGSSFTNLYQLGNQYIGFTELFKQQLSNDYLEKSKRELDNLYTDLKPNAFKNYESRIEKSTNYEVLIQSFTNTIDNKDYYTFKIVNKNYSQLLSGIIQFPESEKIEASRNLDNILKSIRF